MYPIHGAKQPNGALNGTPNGTPNEHPYINQAIAVSDVLARMHAYPGDAFQTRTYQFVEKSSNTNKPGQSVNQAFIG